MFLLGFRNPFFMKLFHYLMASSFGYIMLQCDNKTQQSVGRVNICLYYVHIYSEQN